MIAPWSIDTAMLDISICIVLADLSNTPIIGFFSVYIVACDEYGFERANPTTSKYILSWSCETMYVAKVIWFSPATNPCSPSMPGIVSG
jgi:hypothetical protein